MASDASVSAVTLSRNFTDGVGTDNVDLALDVFVVTLVGTDGAVGVPGTVCTDGWRATHLTGAFSMIGPPIPNPLDEVVAADWTPAQGSILGVAFRNEAEWCVSITSGTPKTPFNVTLDFVLVRSTAANTDNVPIAVVGSNVIEIAAEPDFSELRHVSSEGRLIDTQDTSASLPGSYHTASIIPSAEGDTLSPSGISWGGGMVGSVSTVYNDNIGGAPALGGVIDGTLCFSWTVASPGTQFVNLSFHKASGPNSPETRQASWDTNGDGNGGDPAVNTALMKRWIGFDRTEITKGNDPTENILTDQTVVEPLQFNIADGTWVLGNGSIAYSEWVLGPEGELLDGTLLELTITSTCGYFAREDDEDVSLGKVISGISVNGRLDRTSQGDPLGDGPDDFHVGTHVDSGCTPNKAIEIEIVASRQGGSLLDTETLRIEFSATSGASGTSVPILAWVGQTVPIAYSFNVTGTCDDESSTVHFIRSSGPGTWLPAEGFTAAGSDSMSGTFTDCDSLLFYESEDVGEVNIEVVVSGNSFSKAVYHIFYMAFEDVTLSATPELFVSEIGDVTATVRGWFPGSNPSGRDALSRPDGRNLPRDRWVLPDDWDQLRGIGDFRPGWPNTAPMPLTNVTFFMENEAVSNSFPAGIDHGGLGWFVLDGTESALNVNPQTGIPSVLGTLAMPRILTDLTDGDGVATVDSFGDFNLGYADCVSNAWEGSPQCTRDDFLGATTYYAVAEYPENIGKWAPVRSDNATPNWLWAGYKEVTVVDGESSSIKYIVAHLRDRDGFCTRSGTTTRLEFRSSS